jgi:two-component system, sensor histidine kinase YesM
MRNKLRSFINNSIRNKLLFYFLFLILLSTTTLTIWGNIIYKDAIEKEVNNYTVQMIDQVKGNVDFYIKDMENIIDNLGQQQQIINFLNYNDNNVNKLDYKYTEAETIKLMKAFTSLHTEITGMMIVNANANYASDEMEAISRDPLTEESWYKQAIETPLKIHLFSKPIGRNIRNKVNNSSADDVVSVVKAIVDPKSGKCIGVILIDMNINIITKTIDKVTLGKTGFLYITDGKGEIVYAPENPVVYRIRDDLLTSNNYNSVIENIKTKKYQIIYKDSSYTHWKTIGVFSLDEKLKAVTDIRTLSLIVALVTALIAIVLAAIFSSSIAKPIKKLRRLMKKSEEGDFDVQFDSKYSDEIGQLGSSFNNMIKEIKQLINMVQVEEESKRKAEIKILQAQIKPHFLYNTLDTIQWMAEEHKADDIVEIVNALTNLIRISLSHGEEVINLKDEIGHVESYLIIQKVRYEDKIDYEINYDKKLMNFKVLKLILQPIVENSIYHGIKEKRGGGKIIINIKEAEEKLLISVIDTGVGIPESKLKLINDILTNKIIKQDGMGYGIYNVNDRIRLTYGDDYGLRYESVYGQGTTVELWHPLIK